MERLYRGFMSRIFNFRRCLLGIGVIYVLDRTPNLKTKTTPKFGGCEFLFVKNLMIKTKLIILWT
jgi:hypothetical protein